ncbi:MAG: hypothetical protein ABIG86_03320 [Patescibacteria group bacterium]
MSIVSPIASSGAGVAVIISTLLFKENLATHSLVGILAILVGIIITSTNFENLKKNFSKSSINKGVSEALIFALLIGLWFPLWDKFVGGDDGWLFWLILLKLLMGVMLGVYSYITNYITNRDKKLLRGYEAVVKILIPVAVLDALAYLGTTWGYSVTQNTTSLITVVANAYSLPTVVLSFLLLRERVSKTQALGIVSIIGGIVISSF